MLSQGTAVLLLLLAASAVLGFPTGAPDRACDSMEPQHDSKPQQTPFPYSINCAQTASDRVTVEVKGDEGFKGILVQLRSGNTQVGKFLTPSNRELTTTCQGRAGTHATPSKRHLAVFMIRVTPNELQRDLQCVVTAVKDKEIYWVKETVPLRKKNIGGSLTSGITSDISPNDAEDDPNSSSLKPVPMKPAPSPAKRRQGRRKSSAANTMNSGNIKKKSRTRVKRNRNRDQARLRARTRKRRSASRSLRVKRSLANRRTLRRRRSIRRRRSVGTARRRKRSVAKLKRIHKRRRR